MPDEGIGQRHLELLRAIDEVARRDPAGVSTMYQAAQKIGLNPVGKQIAKSACGWHATSRKPVTWTSTR